MTRRGIVPGCLFAPIARSGLALALVLGIAGCDKHPQRAHPSGTLEATKVDVASTIPGRVEQVRVELGDHVSRGDTLIVLDTELIALERVSAAARQSTLAAQRSEALHLLEQAENREELATTTLKRMQALRAKGSASQQQIDDLTAQRDIAINEVLARRDRLGVLDAQERELRASLAVFDRQLQEGVITAPTPGTVLVKGLEPGEFTSPGRLGIRIADLSELELRIFLEANDLDRVQIGQELPIRVDALANEELRGRVSWISSEAEFTPKNVQTAHARAQLVYAVKLRVRNDTGRLHIGMPAEVRLP